MVKNAGIFLSVLILFSFACNQANTSGSDKEYLPSSSGKYGEVLVVIDTTYENAKSGEAIRKIFNQPLAGLPQLETQFRMSTVSSKSFKSILRRSRNVLKLKIEKGRKTDIAIERDVWASNQLLIQITAATDSDAARILNKNTQTIRDYFNEEEIKRLKAQYAKKPNNDLVSTLKESYDISLLVPPAFILMKNTEKGFWLKKEKKIGQHQVIQGLMVYTEPYTNDSLFNSRAMINSRDAFTKEFVEGSREESYMVVYDEVLPDTTTLNLSDNYVKEYRGLWNMENDFMGGPYLHYSIVDTNRSRLIHLDGFVFAPKFNKREYLRELEALMRTLSIQNPSN